jgi:hypothetical protein
MTDHRDYGDETSIRQKFKYYLHDNYTSIERRDSLEEKGIILSEEAWEKMKYAFYEVELDCEVDEDGNVTILGAK